MVFYGFVCLMTAYFVYLAVLGFRDLDGRFVVGSICFMFSFVFHLVVAQAHLSAIGVPQKHAEYVLMYSKCQEKQTEVCSTVERDVLSFNAYLAKEKEWNDKIDILVPDSVVELPRIE